MKDASYEKAMVNIWHSDDNEDVERIWYKTIGKDPQVMIYDINFDGQPEYKTVWRDHEIVEVYEWKNDKWQQKKLKHDPKLYPIAQAGPG